MKDQRIGTMAHATEDDSSTLRIEQAKASLNERKIDPKLRAQTERILAMPIHDRLRQIEEEANFFLTVKPLDD